MKETYHLLPLPSLLKHPIRNRQADLVRRDADSIVLRVRAFVEGRSVGRISWISREARRKSVQGREAAFVHTLYSEKNQLIEKITAQSAAESRTHTARTFALV